MPPPAPKQLIIEMDEAVLERLLDTPHYKLTIEVDFFMMFTPIMDKGRPYYPYSLFMVDAKGGFILGHDLLYVENSVEEMWGKVTMSVARGLTQLNMIPFQIKVRPGLLAAVLQPLADTLHFKLRVTSRLRGGERSKPCSLNCPADNFHEHVLPG